MNRRFQFLCLTLLCSLPLLAEDEGMAEEDAAALEEVRQAVAEQLQAKFRDPKKGPVQVVIIDPIDQTGMKLAKPVSKSIKETLHRFKIARIRQEGHSITDLTLEQFREALVKTKSDILIVSILKPTSFEFLLYDRRTPYYVFGHSEELMPEDQADFTLDAAQAYADQGTRRLLYQYIREQFYELPRTPGSKAIDVDIPRWIASQESVTLLNQQAQSEYYIGTSLGAAFTMGSSSAQGWNSSILSLELGARIGERLFFEVAGEAFSYYAGIGSLKYWFYDRDSSFRFGMGLGVAYTLNRATLNWDAADDVGSSGIYAVPSISLMAPLVDAFLQIESRFYIGGSKRFVFTIMPGLVILF